MVDTFIIMDTFCGKIDKRKGEEEEEKYMYTAEPEAMSWLATAVKHGIIMKRTKTHEIWKFGHFEKL